MAWTAPKTWSTLATTITAAELNTHLRDNLLETMPAKATREGSHFVATGANSLEERYMETERITATESGTSGSATYEDLATPGPSVTVETGTRALVMFSAHLENSNNDAGSVASYQVTGDTTYTSSTSLDSWAMTVDGLAASNNQWAFGMWNFHASGANPLTPGINTFTMKYRGGGAGTVKASHRCIAVWPM